MEYVGIVALIVAAYAAYKASQKASSLVVRAAAVNPGYSKRESDAQIAKLAKEISRDVAHIRERAYELQARVLELESKD